MVALGNRISDNVAEGIFIHGPHGAAQLYNNIISANGGDGIRRNGGSAEPTMRIWNNTIFGNGGNGIHAFAGSLPITNNLIMGNVGYGIVDEASNPSDNSAMRNNCLYGNSGGLYRGTEGRSYSIREINVLAGCDGNISTSPGLGNMAFGFTDNANITFDPATQTSTLTDMDADFSGLDLVNQTLNSNINQSRQFLIIGRSSNTITVHGNMRTVVETGINNYAVLDPLYYNPESLLIDAGDPMTHPYLPPTDFGGGPRILGARVDIGAHEFDPDQGN